MVNKQQCSLFIVVRAHVAPHYILLVIQCMCVCSGISCMAQDCSLQMPEDFVLPLLPAEELKDKYRRYLFRDYVEVCVFAQMLCQVCKPPTAKVPVAFKIGFVCWKM